jgi:hypothetical protein
LHEAEALSPKKRREALQVLRTLRRQSAAPGIPAMTTRKTLGKARAAIRAARGMWRNRTDLPHNTVEASLELQRRLIKRD